MDFMVYPYILQGHILQEPGNGIRNPEMVDMGSPKVPSSLETGQAWCQKLVCQSLEKFDITLGLISLNHFDIIFVYRDHSQNLI